MLENTAATTSESTSASKIGSSSFWMAFCLTFPVVSKLLLPSSFEELLEIQVFDIPVFLPSLLVLLFLAGKKSNHNDKWLRLIFGLQLISVIIGFISNYYEKNPLALLLAGDYYYYAIYLGLTCRLNHQERYWIGKIYTATLFILGTEVILLGLGLVSSFGSVAVADSAESFDSFNRVSTTAGAATGTAVLLYMLTSICILLSESRRWRYILFAFGFSATLLTVSRGASVAFMMYFVMWLYFKIKERKGKRFKLIFGTAAAFVLLYSIGIFNPILERITIKSQNDTMFESREDRAGMALLYYQNADSKLLGVGFANLYRSTEVRHIGIDCIVAPHNSYIQTLCEQGIIGLVLLLVFWIAIIIINRGNKAILIPLIPLLLVIWNTESCVVVETEYVLNIAILLILGLDKPRFNQLNVL